MITTSEIHIRVITGVTIGIITAVAVDVMAMDGMAVAVAAMAMDVMPVAADVMATDVAPEDVTALADERAAVKTASVPTVPRPITSHGVE